MRVEGGEEPAKPRKTFLRKTDKLDLKLNKSTKNICLRRIKNLGEEIT